MFGKKNKKIESIPRLITALFVIIACTQTISSLFLFNSPEYALADDKKFIDPYTYQVQIGTEAELKFTEHTTRPIADYIKVLYKYAIGAVGIIAAVVLMIGGVIWLTAGGSATRVTMAKDFIGSSLTGLVLVLCSYIIFYQINPDLVRLKVTDIKPVAGDEFVGELGPLERTGCDWEKLQYCPVGKDKKPVEGECDPEKEPEPFLLQTGSGLEKSTTYVFPICCCDPLKWDDWHYDPGIKAQIEEGHANPYLERLLTCMREKLPSNIGRISSISDSAVVKINWAYCTTQHSEHWCETHPNLSPCCAHIKNSCHYGGIITGHPGMSTDPEKIHSSLAVDFGDDEHGDTIIDAAYDCFKKSGIGKGKIIDEGDHIHIQTSNCISGKD